MLVITSAMRATADQTDQKIMISPIGGAPEPTEARKDVQRQELMFLLGNYNNSKICNLL